MFKFHVNGAKLHVSEVRDSHFSLSFVGECVGCQFSTNKNGMFGGAVVAPTRDALS